MFKVACEVLTQNEPGGLIKKTVLLASTLYSTVNDTYVEHTEVAPANVKIFTLDIFKFNIPIHLAVSTFHPFPHCPWEAAQPTARGLIGPL